MALWISLGRAARSQVLFRSGQSLEQLAQVNSLFFDKTGTLTSGETRVAAFVCDAVTDRDEAIERGARRLIVLDLARRGADVSIVARNLGQPAEALANQVQALGRRALLLAGDMARPEDCAVVVEKTAALAAMARETEATKGELR